MRNMLPSEFQFSYDYAMYLHDCLAQVLVHGEKSGAFKTRFTLSEDTDMGNWSGEQLFKWLEETERGDVLAEVLLKTVFPALLSDFCHFIYEALTCSRKGKLTVAYCLLRKPLKENLHYMEWLLADPDSLLSTLYNEDSSKLSFSAIGDPARIKSTIQKAVTRCPNSGTFDPDFLYELRFDKAREYGFDGYCNQAMHLITTKSPIATERQNFNFIFTNDNDREAQWKHIYGALPYILFYATDIVECLITVIRKETLPDYPEAVFHKSIGFILWSESRSEWSGKQPRSSSGMPTECPKCKSNISLTSNDLRMLFRRKDIVCSACKKNITYLEMAYGGKKA